MTADRALHARALAAATSLTRPCTHRPEEPEMTDTDQASESSDEDRAMFLRLIDSLLDSYKPYGVVLWLNAVNRNLDPMGTTPAHLIAHSNWQPLLDEADRLAGGSR